MPRPACFDFQTLHANPAEEQGGIWIVVASAGTMSHFTGYPTRSYLTVAKNFSPSFIFSLALRPSFPPA
jgi:hypothetical protein